MLHHRLRQLAVDRHAEAIRSGTAGSYECLRYFLAWHSYDGDDKLLLLQRALRLLVAHDPLLLVTHPGGSHGLTMSEDDIRECVGAWNLGDEGLAAFLEAHLRLAVVSRHAPDLAMVRAALRALDRAAPHVPRDEPFLDLLSDALRMLGDERYDSVFDELLEATAPEWRAHPLHWAMEHVLARGDRPRYDELRRRFGALPRGAHVCECMTNFVANIDGLHALERGDVDAALACLRQAVSVPGCPHLNSGGAALQLARELTARGLAEAEVREHLDAVDQYHPTEGTLALRKQLDAGA